MEKGDKIEERKIYIREKKEKKTNKWEKKKKEKKGKKKVNTRKKKKWKEKKRGVGRKAIELQSIPWIFYENK